MLSLIKAKQYSKLSYKLGFYSAIFGFIEWFYWIAGLVINLEGWGLITAFFIIAIIITIASVIFGLLAIGDGIVALKKDDDKKLAKKGITYGILGMGLVIGLWLYILWRRFV